MTNINVKSHYSFRQSLLKIKDIVSFTKNNDFKYVCLCDTNYFGGALELLTLAKKNKIQAILGLEFKVTYNEETYNILAYSLNKEGYHSLMKLSSYINRNNDKVIDYEIYTQYKEHLIILIDVMSSNIYKDYLLEKDYTFRLKEYISLFNSFYYFIQDYHLDKDFVLKFREIYNPSYEIAASSKRYLNSEDESTLQVLKHIENYHIISNDLLNSKGQDYLYTLDGFNKHYTTNVLDNTNQFLSLFQEINLEQEQTLPMYKESTELINAYLKKLALTGLQKRLNTNEIPSNYLERLKFELNTVISMNYSDYFLIVYDYVLYAKKQGIYVGPGRGSAAGSLLSYTLGITNVDPIKEGLIFERFLNPERISLPDIDVDFQANRRDEILSYLKDKYGTDKVANLVTYDLFQNKSALIDVGKVLDIPVYKVNSLKDYLKNDQTLKQILETDKRLQRVLEKDELLSTLYKHATKLQGIIRDPSIHASGVLVTKEAMSHYTPTSNETSLVSQYDMYYIESIGLNKLDILGLKTLDILDSIASEISPDFKLESIPLNDLKTLALMSTGQSMGIFQYEADFVRQTLRKMKVDSINDLVATTALCRPGPMQFVDEYIKRKHNQSKIDYILPILKPILEETYGIIVYQEQIMKITQVMANFSMAKADNVRKGMGKKDLALLQEIKEDFVQESIKNGYTLEQANHVYDLILEFSNYGFNKAHAYSYALIGYYMAYLKAHYPYIFYRNILNYASGEPAKLKKIITEMNHFNLKIEGINLNISSNEYVIKDNVYYLPLTFIKGLSITNVNEIISIRNQYPDKFTSYMDAITKLVKGNISETNIQKLIYAGAFDCFDLSRTTMIENLDKVISYLKIASLDTDQLSLAIDVIPPPKIIAYTESHDIASKEFELLGMYIKANPFSQYTETYGDLPLSDIVTNKKALCIVDNVRERKTKKGDLMAYVSVSDQFDNKELIIFPKTLTKLENKIKKQDVLLVEGRFDDVEDHKILVSHLKVVTL